MLLLKQRFAFICSFTLVFLFSSGLEAAGFRLPNQSAFATARGNAFTATANNASAVYYNPAGITQLDGNQMELGIYSINFAVDVTNDAGDFSNNDKFQFVPQAYYTSESNGWSWGLGLYAPFGLGNDWPDSTSFSTITTSAEITYLTLSPVVAKEIAPGISVGAGLTLNYADTELKQAIGPGAEFVYSGDDYEVGYVLSGLAKLGEHHRFGLTYRSKATHDLSGKSDPGASPGGLSITVPALVSIGYAYQPSAEWDFEVNVEWGDWSELDQITITNTAIAPPPGDVPVGFDWDDGYIYQFGATRYFEDYAISFGYDYNESVQTEMFYTPSVSDADRHWFNFGYTRFYEDKSWTLTYQYGTSSRTVDESAPNLFTETANGRYEVDAHSLSFSYDLSL